MEVDCKIEIEKLRLITATIFVFSNFRREFNSAGKLMSITLSVTRWLLYYFSIFCHLQQWKFAQWQTKFVKVGSKVCQILNKLSINCQKPLRFCQSGKNSPNLVTLNEWNVHLGSTSDATWENVQLFLRVKDYRVDCQSTKIFLCQLKRPSLHSSARCGIAWNGKSFI